MNQKKIQSILSATIMIAVCFAATIPAFAESGNFHTVKGAAYINNILAPIGTPIFLVFPTENLSRPTFAFDQGYNYAISFTGHEGQTGNFYIYFQGQYYVPTDNQTVTIIQDVIGYHINLHITVLNGNNIPPTADAGGPYSGQINTPITFTGAASYDFDGTIIGYRWDWTNDGTFDTAWSTSPTATHTYTAVGGYTARLQVQDDDGAVNNDTASVTISTAPPVNQPPYTPSAPSPLDFSLNQSIFTDLAWDCGDQNSGDTVYYDVYFGTTNPPVLYGTTIGYSATQTRITYSLPQLLFGTQYYWQIIAHDNSGASTTGPVWRFTTVSLGADTQPPSKVTGLTVTDVKDGKLNLQWNPATDNFAVDHYTIYRNDVFLMNTTLTSHQDSGLTNGQSYTYQVSAVDTSGNEGQKSDNATGTPTATSNPPSNPPTTTNKPPIADTSAGEPYQGIIGETILFNGSKSHDPDGTIVKWYWTFGDGTNASGTIVTHSYATAGMFTVKLTVTDNLGLYTTKVTKATITTPNEPPSQPTFNGPTSGEINTSYTYTAVSTDPENSNLTYTFDWGDTTSTTTTLPNGTTAMVNHTWTSAGVYYLTVDVKDDQNTLSVPASLTVLINVEYVGDIGHLIDHDNDGTYDAFYSNQTQNEERLEKQANGTYFIDSDGDDDWDYIYDPQTKELTLYPTKEEGTPTNDMPMLILAGILGIIAVLFIAILLLTRKKKNTQESDAQAPETEKPTVEPVVKKKTTAKKSAKTKKK